MPGRPTHPHHPPQPSFTHPISNFHRRPHLDVSATRCSPASQTTNPTHRSPTFTDHLSTHCNPPERTPTPTTVAHPQPAPPFPRSSWHRSCPLTAGPPVTSFGAQRAAAPCPSHKHLKGFCLASSFPVCLAAVLVIINDFYQYVIAE